MNNQSTQPENESTLEARKRIATIIAAVLLVTLVVFDIFSTYNYLAQPNTFLLFAMLLSFVATASTGVSTWLIRNGRVNSGTWGLILTNLIALFLSPLLGAGLGFVYGITAIIVTAVISQGLERKQVGRAILAGIGVGIATIFLDILLPASNNANPNNGFTYIILGFLIVALLIIVARQFTGYTLRNKLLVAFIGITVIATGMLSAYTITTTTNALQASLERDLSGVANSHATQIGDLFNEQIDKLTTLSLNEILQQAVIEQNQSYTGTAAETQAEIDAKDAQWRAADKANNDLDPLVREHLTNPAALNLSEYRTAFPDNVEVFITDVQGGLVSSTNRTSDYNQADEAWWQAAYNNDQGEVYIGNPEFDESAGKLAIQFALPLRDRVNGKIIGILRTTYIMTPLAAILKQDVGETSSADIFIPGQTDSHIHEGLLEPIDPQVFEQLKAVAGQGLAEMNYEGVLSVVTQARINSRDRNPAVENLGWVVVFHQNQAEAFAPVNERLRGTTIVIVVVIFLAVLAAIFLAQALVRPLNQLTNTAQEIAAGNLNSQAQVTSADEIGILAVTFNNMTSQLRELIGSLEGRVAARTKDLEIVAEVSTATSTILQVDSLLQEVVNLTKERFNLYHSHIYLLDEAGENLVLASGAGEAGRIMVTEKRSIPLDREQSLVARAAREGKGVIVNDVTLAPDFLPNVLLPDTRSELAVPMIVGGRVIGVFDIQSDRVGRFTESDINIQTTLAAQVSTSIQNVRSFEQSKIQADYEALVNTIGQKIQRATTMEDTLQTAIRELGLALGASRVSAKISQHKDGNDLVGRN
jgi:putative methionine-R-sulfoxide reductase with GAF domain/HAMP domain-containing protein